MTGSSRLSRAVFVLLLLVCLAPDVGPAVGLLLGGVVGLGLGNPFPGEASRWSKTLLQVAVVGLGFGLEAKKVLATGLAAIPATLIGIVLTFALGAVTSRLLGAERTTAFLVTTGTSICGGSAIAAMAPVVEADNEQTAVSLATVFTLNAVGLFLFPLLGHWLALPQQAFGVWSAVAIHDTSSVVGAAASYGDQALAVATTVKLTRALWIVPLVLVVGLLRGAKSNAKPPLFLVGFVLAVLLRAYAPPWLEPIWAACRTVARQLLVVTLFLIGAGLTRALLARVGPRPLAHGVLLWALVSAGTLYAVQRGWLS